jgi:cell wall-associated NlpC family hydrolase
MRFVSLLVAVCVFLLVAAVKGTHVDVTCGGAVSTPWISRVIAAGEHVGDVVTLFRGEVSAADEVRAVLDIRNGWRLFRDAFTAHARGEPESFGVLKTKQAVADQQAAALAGCAAPAPTDPANPPGQSCPGAPGPDPASMSAGLRGRALALAVAQRYWPAAEWPMAVRVMELESGYDPTAWNGIAAGIMQINLSAHPDLVRGRNWKDPFVNGSMGHEIWLDAGRSWGPWTTAGRARASLDASLSNAPGTPGAPDRNSLGGPCQAIPINMAGARAITDAESGKLWHIPIPSGKAGVAINAGLDQVGKPYVWAAHGPNSFDCSGLVSWAWGKAGVSVFPQTEVMWRSEPRATGLPQPGDLWGWPGHIQMFLGRIGGQDVILEAPRPGRKVHIVPEYRTPSRKLRPYGATPTGIAA